MSASSAALSSITSVASTVIKAASSTVVSSAGVSSTSNAAGIGSAQTTQGQSLTSFLGALVSGLVIFGVQLFTFLLLKEKLARIFKPKTYLVPEKERTEPPPRTPWGWLLAIFRFRDREVIKKCGLDAYFFLRYLQTLLIIFIPMAVVILPVLLPMNYHGGRGPEYANEFKNGGNHSVASNVTGLDQLAWGNVRPDKTNRYWGHLILALATIVWVCGVFFSELRVYIKVRQDYLTSAEHRLRASATTVLVTAISQKWLTEEAIAGLYDVFPGGIRNVWINRKFDDLLDKIGKRDKIFKKLESAETDLIKTAKKNAKKMREKAEKEERSNSSITMKARSKEEKAQKVKDENAAAEKLAQGGGMTTGAEAPHTVDDAIDEEVEKEIVHDQTPAVTSKRTPGRGGGIAAIGKGFETVGGTVFGGARNVGETVFDGARNAGKGLNHEIETTNGFMNIRDSRSDLDDECFDQYGRYRPQQAPAAPFGSGTEQKETVRNLNVKTSPTTLASPHSQMPSSGLPGNTVHAHGLDGAFDESRKEWWEFWKPPSGGFASPRPQTREGGDSPVPLTRASSSSSKKAKGPQKPGFGARVKGLIPFLHDDKDPREYQPAFNPEYRENASGAAWEQFMKESERPHHRLAKFSWTPGWLPGLPLLNKKVDTIYWCRGELARLNLEIEEDQKEPERFPIMNSAFIQFNHQVAAHMCAQSVIHHVPKHMAPRTVEISPDDVLWNNMSIKWWETWLRTFIVIVIVTGMVILWTFPVAFTASIAQINVLADTYDWLNWLNDIPPKILSVIAGILPPLLLAILLALVPPILNLLAFLSGVQTGVAKQKAVQNFYFAFLFVQVFLVVSVSTSAITTLTTSFTNIQSIPETLATQIPKSSNYFFSYMILQALSVSSSNLLQLATLIFWFILPKLFDSTARQKWKRNTTLPHVTWGTYFPVYTNFACIALIYSVIAPIIIVFAIITFTLLWIANRYKMLYVSRFKIDTGGLLYPTAINQTFVGLYFMEICLIGLFFITPDSQGNQACFPQAIIMILALFFTMLYQFLLNQSFAPLFKHLPITFEDEAVIRDEVFERAQARRLGIDIDDDEDLEAAPAKKGDIELANLNATRTGMLAKLNPKNLAADAGNWVTKSGRKTFGRSAPHHSASTAHLHSMRKRRHRDIEEQRKIADALYGGIHDEIEDLTPDERDVLVRHAFQHYALRARRPTVWIPRDDIGVSDDEVRRTRAFAGENIWISNVGAALDGRGKVVYGKNPPDFSEIDLINL
ncbi:hypothetical protein BJ878DRAFT_564958 [Calycina marina]|uniref:DUF221-domain-containing protein n=1 Tax=Calycina marina TaxID=1763456 RepID=A0A9P8CJD6_9HELO|nr:hypothetical protein BJ878DRAFT_564958 [Calycina marina]